MMLLLMLTIQPSLDYHPLVQYQQVESSPHKLLPVTMQHIVSLVLEEEGGS